MSKVINVRLDDDLLEKISKFEGNTSEVIKMMIESYDQTNQKVVQKIQATSPGDDIMDTTNKMIETYKNFGGIKILPKDTYTRDEFREYLGLDKFSKEYQTTYLTDIKTIHYYKWKKL